MDASTPTPPARPACEDCEKKDELIMSAAERVVAQAEILARSARRRDRTVVISEDDYCPL